MRHAAAPSPRYGRRVLAEVQALRAVAVGLVILFHLWPSRLTGGYIGVDVFFVISGFLITAHLLRELDTTGTVDLPRFWARRIRRLLPAALLVLAATFVAVLTVMPQPAWQRVVVELGAAAAYVLNWVLASSAVDYFAAENAATPVQHYWSLSVEEQFYVVWPVLLLGLAAVARRRAAAMRPALAGGVGVVLGLSFAYSVWFTATSPAAAYFSTPTHAWEFASGALLALVLPRLALGAWSGAVTMRALAALVGLGTLVACGFWFDGATPFPGWFAALPVAGTLLVIAAGDTGGSALSVMPALRWRPVQVTGDVSYSAYLWHWPPIVVLPAMLGRPLGTTDKLVVLAATFAVAWASKRYVEDPFRTQRTATRRQATHRSAFVAAAAAAAVVVSGSTLVWTDVERRTDAAIASAQGLVDGAVAGTPSCFGAGAVLSGQDCPEPWTVDPDLVLATQPVGPSDPPQVDVGGGLTAGQWGPADGATTIALVGDSHAGHYLPALEAVAERNDWRILMFRHNNCSPSAPTWVSPVGADMGETCQEWRRDLLERLPTVEGIDLVITSSVAPRYGPLVTDEAGRAEIADAFVQMWRAWTDAGKRVLVIADVPGPADAVGETSECVAQADTTVDPCPSPRAEVVEHDAMVAAAADGSLPVTLIDWTDMYCGARECHSVIGGLVVYGGGAHISRLFAVSLAPYLEHHISEALTGSPGAGAS